MGGTTTTTQNTSAQPYGPAKGLIKQAMRDAGRAYSRGIGGQVYTGSTVIPFSQQTMQGMDGIMAAAGANSGGNGMSGALQGILDNGGFTGQQTRSMNGMESLANSDAINGMINSPDGLTQDQRDVIGRWKDTATSSFDPNTIPGFSEVLRNTLESAGTGINAQAAAAGRYGSGANQGILAREQGKIGANLTLNEYARWKAEQDAANRGIADLSQTGTGNRSAAIGQKSGLLGQLFNANQSGIGNMGAAYDALQNPYKAQMGVGAMYEDLATRQKNDELRIFDAQQTAPWEQFARLMNVANMTGQYAPRSTVSTQPGPNPLLTTLGGLATGYGMLGSIFGGGAAGGLGGLSGGF